MSVPKKDEKVRMCVDYRDLNKACPKDDFPLPHIDTLVDSAASSAMYSFMDDFSGYNQIMMAVIDKLKMSFTTEWGIYCYTIMPFRLKNVGATYQRIATTLLHGMIHKEIEVYVDDMVVRSETFEEHYRDIEKFMERLTKFNVRLNPKKYIFGMAFGKMLRYIASQNGIKVDPNKAKVIREMPVPKKKKEIRGFLGKL